MVTTMRRGSEKGEKINGKQSLPQTKTRQSLVISRTPKLVVFPKVQAVTQKNNSANECQHEAAELNCSEIDWRLTWWKGRWGPDAKAGHSCGMPLQGWMHTEASTPAMPHSSVNDVSRLGLLHWRRQSMNRFMASQAQQKETRVPLNGFSRMM